MGSACSRTRVLPVSDGSSQQLAKHAPSNYSEMDGQALKLTARDTVAFVAPTSVTAAEDFAAVVMLAPGPDLIDAVTTQTAELALRNIEYPGLNTLSGAGFRPGARAQLAPIAAAVLTAPNDAIGNYRALSCNQPIMILEKLRLAMASISMHMATGRQLASIFGLESYDVYEFTSQAETDFIEFTKLFSNIIGVALPIYSKSSSHHCSLNAADTAERMLWSARQVGDASESKDIDLSADTTREAAAVRVKSFCNYGAVILAVRDLAGSDDGLFSMMRIACIGLSDWKVFIHNGPSGYTHTSKAISAVAIPSKDVYYEQYDDFMACLELNMSHHKKMEEKRINELFKSGSSANFPRAQTPAVVHNYLSDAGINYYDSSLLKKALKSSWRGITDPPTGFQTNRPPDGWTDVGAVEGGLARNTSWRLAVETVRAAFLVHSTAAGGTRDGARDGFTRAAFETTTAVFEATLLAMFVNGLSACTATESNVNDAVTMLEAVAQSAAALARDNADVTFFVGICQEARMRLDDLVAERAREVAAGFKLRTLEPAAVFAEYRNVTGILPKAVEPPFPKNGLAAMKAAALANFQPLPLLTVAPSADDCFSNALNWATGLAAAKSDQTTYGAQLLLQSIDRLVYSFAMLQVGGYASFKALGEAEIHSLLELLQIYRLRLHAFSADATSAARMRVELRSRELLNQWVAYCAAHASAAAKHPELLAFGVALDWHALRHLVLSDKLALDAALSVAAYLQWHTLPDKKVFCLPDHDGPTFSLAGAVANGSARDFFLPLWEEEEKSMRMQEDANWKIVLAKQEQCRQLREEIKTLRSEAAEAEVKEGSARSFLSAAQSEKKVFPAAMEARQKQLSEEVATLSNELQSHEGDLSRSLSDDLKDWTENEKTVINALQELRNMLDSELTNGATGVMHMQERADNRSEPSHLEPESELDATVRHAPPDLNLAAAYKLVFDRQRSYDRLDKELQSKLDAVNINAVDAGDRCWTLEQIALLGELHKEVLLLRRKIALEAFRASMPLTHSEIDPDLLTEQLAVQQKYYKLLEMADGEPVKLRGSLAKQLNVAKQKPKRFSDALIATQMDMKAKRDAVQIKKNKAVKDHTEAWDNTLMDYTDEQKARQRELHIEIQMWNKEKLRLEAVIQTKIAELQMARIPPSPIFMPLPMDVDKSMRTLFFLFLPKPFELLSHIGMTAQQALLPRSGRPNFDEIVDRAIRLECGPLWSAHFNGHGPVKKASDATVKMHTELGNKDPENFGKDDVDLCKSSRDQVFYPDGFGRTLSWSGGGFKLDERKIGSFNPFAFVKDEMIETCFTELLPPTFEKLQWTMDLPSKPELDRGNKGIALVGTRVNFEMLTDKDAFLAFCALRAYPNQQLRKLIGALKDDMLPLSLPAVGVLVRQSMYQIGALAVDSAGRPYPSWRGDLFLSDGGALAALRVELQRYCKLLAKNSSRHEDASLLTAVLDYYGGWDPSFHIVSRDLAKALRAHADAISIKIEKSPPEMKNELEAKRAAFNMRALLCYGSSRLLEAQDVAAVCELAILCHPRLYAAWFTVQATDDITAKKRSRANEEDLRLRVQCASLLANRTPEIVAELQRASCVPGKGDEVDAEDPTIDDLIHEGAEAAEFEGDSRRPAATGMVKVRRGPPRKPPPLMAMRMRAEASDLEGTAANTFPDVQSEDAVDYDPDNTEKRFCRPSARVLLSHAARLVLSRATIPDGLRWAPCELDTSNTCFDAIWYVRSKTGQRRVCLVSLNVSNGAVLLDGKPPSSLPLEIRNHELYHLVFGRHQDLSATLNVSRGIWTTTRPIDGCIYSFYLSPPDRLTVLEIVEDTPPLELLGPGDYEVISSLCANLPERLHVFTLWLSRRDDTRGRPGVIVLRGSGGMGLSKITRFRERSIHFVLLSEPDSSWACFRVPSHLQLRPWTLLAEQAPSSFDRLVVPRIPAAAANISALPWPTRALAKLENPAYIHAYMVSMPQATATPLLVLRVHLPRFELDFELGTDGRLMSLSHKGHWLAEEQQLDDVLRGFQGYVVLNSKSNNGETVLLVADGRVQKIPDIRSETTTVVASDSAPISAPGPSCFIQDVDWHLLSTGKSESDLQKAYRQRSTHRFVIHPRFNNLTATSISARLQLAALFAATSTRLLEPRMGCTGTEAAMELVRGCWVNRPLRAEEVAQLQDVRANARHEPALLLLCEDIETSASQLNFLYEGQCESSGNNSPNEHVRAAYLQLASTPANPRRLLSSADEVRILGRLSERPGATILLPGQTMRLPDDVVLERAQARASWADVSKSYDEELRQLWRETPSLAIALDAHAGRLRSQVASAPVFPLKQEIMREDPPPSKLANQMYEDLRKSWEVYISTRGAELSTGAAERKAKLLAIQARVVTDRAGLESHLLSALQTLAPPEKGHLCSQCGHEDADSDSECAIHEDGLLAMHRLHQAAGVAPTATVVDLARIFLNCTLALQFQPFLSTKARRMLRERIGAWLTLCVLEDKLRRMVPACDAGDAALLLNELRAERRWRIDEHPEWLCFEVEGGLQIRPVQYAIAKYLIEHDDDGSVVQLNMGEGKTRVILPMLALYWGSRKESRDILRLHFLPALIDEAFDFLHLNLAASSLVRRKIFRMPFHRQVDLNSHRAGVMRECLKYCQRECGLLLVSPEHRLSLGLKWHELRMKGSQNKALMSALERLYALPYRDLLDECDELLRHRWKLVYSTGEKTGTEVAGIDSLKLPSGEQRWRMTHAVLRLLRRQGPVMLGLEKLGLLGPDVVKWGGRPNDPGAGAYDSLLLLPGPKLDALLPKLYAAIVDALIDSPPRGLELRALATALSDLRTDVLKLVADPSFEVDPKLGPDEPDSGLPALSKKLDLQRCHEDELLALRGLLAYGYLVHCLQLRHNVNYGINRSAFGGQKPKRLAVPFVAANTPSYRSEFANHDIAIILTTLSYYGDGLSRDQLETVFNRLFLMGKDAQQTLYSEWWHSGGGALAPVVQIRSMESFDCIDLSDSKQFDVLMSAFARNVEVVNFYLNGVLFPLEIAFYPSRLQAGPWNLADNRGGLTTGFSGTADTRHLLPWPIKLADTDDRESGGTDGKMLFLLRKNSRLDMLPPPAVAQAAVTGGAGQAQWEAVVEFCAALLTRNEAHALVDAGGLMAGASNRQVAERLIERLCMLDSGQDLNAGLLANIGQLPVRLQLQAAAASSARFLGVLFFDVDDREWKVMDRQLRCFSRHSSPIEDKDTFAFFDESRCRGADLKLDRIAVAVVTVGPGLQKDKLMQACGRMRQLHAGQSVRFLVPREVMIRLPRPEDKDSERTSLQLLDWAMQNTVEATASGLPEWAAQGAHFYCTRDDADAEVIPEHTENVMWKLFAPSRVPRRIRDIMQDEIQRRTAFVKTVSDTPGMPEGQAIVAAIKNRAENYGMDILRISTEQDEECERECEREVEKQLQSEVEFEKTNVQPRFEDDWQITDALQALTPAAVALTGRIVRLDELILESYNSATGGDVMGYLKASLVHINWSSRVYLTRNFAYALKDMVKGLDGYLRLVDVVLCYPNGELLLLSEREADAALSVTWRASQMGITASPTSLSLPWRGNNADAAASHVLGNLCLIRGARAGNPLAFDADQCASVQLFAGETKFPSPRVLDAVRAHLQMAEAKESAIKLPTMRGRAMQYPYSHLQDICDRREGKHQIHVQGANRPVVVNPPYAYGLDEEPDRDKFYEQVFHELDDVVTARQRLIVDEWQRARVLQDIENEKSSDRILAIKNIDSLKAEMQNMCMLISPYARLDLACQQQLAVIEIEIEKLNGVRAKADAHNKQMQLLYVKVTEERQQLLVVWQKHEGEALARKRAWAQKAALEDADLDTWIGTDHNSIDNADQEAPAAAFGRAAERILRRRQANLEEEKRWEFKNVELNLKEENEASSKLATALQVYNAVGASAARRRITGNADVKKLTAFLDSILNDTKELLMAQAAASKGNGLD